MILFGVLFVLRNATGFFVSLKKYLFCSQKAGWLLISKAFVLYYSVSGICGLETLVFFHPSLAILVGFIQIRSMWSLCTCCSVPAQYRVHHNPSQHPSADNKQNLANCCWRLYAVFLIYLIMFVFFRELLLRLEQNPSVCLSCAEIQIENKQLRNSTVSWYSKSNKLQS